MNWLRLITNDEEFSSCGAEKHDECDRGLASVKEPVITRIMQSDTLHATTPEAKPRVSSTFSTSSPIIITPTKFFLVLAIPLFFFGVYYFYNQSVQGDTVSMNNTLATKPSLSDGLVGHWTFDGQDMDWASTTAEVRDRSGNGNHGNLINADNKAAVQGKLGQGMKFDGVDDVATTTSFYVPTSTRTYSVWVKLFSAETNQNILEKDDIILDYRAGDHSFCFYWHGGASYHVISGIVPKKDEWYHVVGVLDGLLYKMYVNGVLRGQFTDMATLGSTNDFLRIGYHFYLGYLRSSLDDVRIYNRALSQEDITALYKMGEAVKVGGTPENRGTLGDGLVGHWTFDGNDMTATTINDRSSTHATGTLTNMDNKSSRVAGKLGQGLKFDGVDDYVSATSLATLDDIATMTVSMWINPKTLGAMNQSQIIRKGSSNASLSWAVQFSAYTTGKLSFGKPFSSVDGYWTVTGADIRLNEWQHVVFVYSRSSSSNVPVAYINGIGAGVTTDAPPAGTADSDASGYLYIGGRPSSTDSFDGTLDDVRIYNRALTQSEITQLYKMGQPVLVNARPQASTTPPAFTCGTDTISDQDGNVYNTILLGTQCWMKQNLRVGTMVTGSTTQTNNATIEKWCYSDTLANCMTNNNPNHPDGGLYQWNEAMQYSTTSGARGICPSGWHIPTHDEYTTLERAVCTSGTCATDFPYNTTTTGYRGTTEGTKLKPNGTSGWEGNFAGNGIAGFFLNRASYGSFWSSSERDSNVWYRSLYYGDSRISRNVDNKVLGFSVRCLKD